MEEEAKKRKAKLEHLRNVRQRSLVKKIDVVEVAESLKSKDTVEGQVDGVTEASIRQLDEIRASEELDLAKAVQTKPDADMKRLLQAKLEQLEIKNQRAILELLKQRLSTSTKSENLADAVAVQEYLNTQ